jgi:transposase-like protein
MSAKLKRRKFSKEEKFAAIRLLENGAAFELNPQMVRRWRDEWLQYGTNAFTGCGNARRQKPLKAAHLVFRLTPAEHERFLERARSSGAATISEFARTKLFELEPDTAQIEQRIAALVAAIERLARDVAKA